MDPSAPPSSTAPEAAPPIANVDQTPPQIPGKERLDEVVGKAVGGTVIPSDIHPSDMPSTTKLEAEKAHLPSDQQPQPAKDAGDKAAKGDVNKEGAKSKTVGAFPVQTHYGWSDAYKGVDGASGELRETSIWMEDFARSVLYGSFWSSAAVAFTIPVVCYVFFKLGGGFISLVLIIAFAGTDRHSQPTEC